MRRKLWSAVLATTLLLVAGGTLPARLPAGWLPALEAAARREAALVLPVLLVALRTPAAVLCGTALLAAGAGASLSLALARRRRDPFRLVVRAARGGRPLARVARRARLAQDAVRTLMAPGRAARRRSGRREGIAAPEGTASRNRRLPPQAGPGMRWVAGS